MKPWLAFLLSSWFLAAPAFAHGPTIDLSLGKVIPSELVVRVGDTVHFRNASRSGAGITLVVVGLDAPTLGRGEGWHHTFEEPGEYPFHLKEFASAKGVVRVVPR